MTNVPDWVPDRLKAVVAEAMTAEETNLATARQAGADAAAKHAPAPPPIPDGYHDPSEPRTEETEPEPRPAPSVPRARRSDPQTSHDAAGSISPEDLRASQLAIKTLLHFSGPLTDSEIIEAYQTYAKREGFPQQSESGLRTRRKELTDLGFVVDSGERKTLPSGRPSIIWKETPQHVESVAEGITVPEGAEDSVRETSVPHGDVPNE